MHWHFQYTPAIWPSMFLVMLLTVLAVYAWRRRNVPGALWLAIYCLFSLFFLTAKVIEFLTVDFEMKIFWFNIEYLWLTPGTTAMTCFILEYVWPRRWVTRRTLALLSIVPLLGLALLFTNPFHNLSFTGYEFTGDVVPLYGPIGWAFLIYNLGLRVVSITALVWLFVRSPQHRWPAVLILLAETVFGVVLVLDPFIQESWFFYVPEKALPVLACTIALFGFRLFDPIPLARQTVIEQLKAGMLVLDLEGRVMSLNPAVERILNAPAKQVKGKLVKELLPAYPEKRLASLGEAEIKLGFGEGTILRYYMLTNSLLTDFRGLLVGRLLLLSDMTEQKRAQTQILEQQKVQAVLEERAGLARELHDSIGQALATAQLQGETANELIDRGDIAAAQDTLSRLVEVTQSAHVDIRQYLLGATLLTPGQDVFVALYQYVKLFSRDFGPPTDLVIAPGVKEQGLDSRAEVQLMRIVQEGLANVRKHAHASAAQVMFSINAGQIQVRIEDDGVGFDVARLFKAKGQRFGLSSMRDRAEAIGGTFQILSAPGRGTRVIVEIPCQSTSSGQGPGRDGLQWSKHGDPQGGDSSEHRPLDRDRPVHQIDYEYPVG
jgi:signal transduction histidine kinase